MNNVNEAFHSTFKCSISQETHLAKNVMNNIISNVTWSYVYLEADFKIEFSF